MRAEDRGEDVREIADRGRHRDVRAAGDAETRGTAAEDERGDRRLRDERDGAGGAHVGAPGRLAVGTVGVVVGVGVRGGGASGGGGGTGAEGDGDGTHGGVAADERAAARAATRVETREVLRRESGLGPTGADRTHGGLAAGRGRERRGDADDLTAAFEHRTVHDDGVIEGG